ncbi:O-antigen ligase family protein [Zhengella sp. ZM62]|uniref:O-antigen ligase family protein n=1 Tax=Zhengella sedimenti TaxID=3390035 RepID=UPI003975E463
MRAYPALILRYLTSPGGQALVAANLLFAVFVAGGVPLAGSGVVVAIAITMGWGALLLLAHRIALPAHRQAWLAAGAFALFFFTEAFTTVLAGLGEDGLKEIGENLPFLGALPLFALLAVSGRRLLAALPPGAAAGAIAGLAAVPLFPFHAGMRIELMAGNPLVLGLAAAVMYGLAVDGVIRLTGRLRWFCLAGALAAAALVILSGSRTFWIALVMSPAVLAAIHLRPGKRSALPLAGALILMGAAGLGAYAFLPPVHERLQAVVADVEKARQGDLNTSFGQRLILWRSAVSLIAEKPLVGHGGGDIPALMAERNAELSRYDFAMTHFHNGLLNVMVRGGAVNLIGFLAAFLAPLVLLWMNRNHADGRNALAAGCALYIPYVLSGTTGIAFGHDIHDSLFIGLCVLCLHASFGSGATSPARDPS